jgi:hypothetical protein
MCEIVGYSRYPGPPKIRVIRETLETPKQPQELNNNFSACYYFIIQYPIYRVTKLELRNDK